MKYYGILLISLICFDHGIYASAAAQAAAPMEGVVYTGSADVKGAAEQKSTSEFDRLCGAIKGAVGCLLPDLVLIIARYQYAWQKQAQLCLATAARCPVDVEQMFATPTHLVASYGTRSQIQTWDLASLASYFLSPGKFESGCALPNGSIVLLQLISNGRLGAKIFPCATVACDKVITANTGTEAHNEPKQVCAIGDTLIVIGLADGDLGFLNLNQSTQESKRIHEEREQTPYKPPVYPSPVTALCKYNEHLLLVGTFNGRVRTLNLKTDQYVGELKFMRESMPARRMVRMPNSYRVVIMRGMKDSERNIYSREMQLWDMDHKKQLFSMNLEGHCVDIVPMSRKRIAYGQGKAVKIFDIEDRKEAYELQHDSSVTCLTRVNRNTLAVGLIDGSIQLWKKTVCKKLKQIVAPTDKPESMDCAE